MKTIKEIVKYVADYEGLKEQVSVGNIREIVGIVSDLIFAFYPLVDVLYNNGKRRAKRKKK
jgi:hypothetical protein